MKCNLKSIHTNGILPVLSDEVHFLLGRLIPMYQLAGLGFYPFVIYFAGSPATLMNVWLTVDEWETSIEAAIEGKRGR